MKNRFEALCTDIEEFHLGFRRKKVLRNNNNRLSKAKNSKKAHLVNLIKEERKEWNKKINGMSLFDGIEFLSSEDEYKINDIWSILKLFETNPSEREAYNDEDIKEFLYKEIKQKGRLKVTDAIIEKKKKDKIRNLESKISGLKRTVKENITEFKKYHDILKKIQQRVKPMADLRKHGSNISILANIGDKAMKWASGRAVGVGSLKASFFTANSKDVKKAVNRLADVLENNTIRQILRTESQSKFRHKKLTSMEELLNEYTRAGRKLESNKKLLLKYQEQLKKLK